MTLGQDIKLGLGMALTRNLLRVQGAFGDPVARVLGRRPDTDPYPRYERLRDSGDLVRSRLGFYATASHPLVNSVLHDPRFGVRTIGDLGRDQWQPATGMPGPHPVFDSFLSLDPPRHTRLRKLVAPWFTPRALRERGDRITDIVTGFLDELAGRSAFDLIGDFAVRVPIQVICDLLGVPDREYQRFARWGALLALTLDETWTMADHRALRAALTEMHEFFTDLVARRRADPGDDVVSELVALGADELTVPDLLATVELLLVAGFETTVNLIGNGVLALLREPAARQRLVDQPDQAPDLVEEVLRHDPPVQYTLRLAHEPVQLGGHTLPRDTPLVLLLAGANRDPDVFDRPAEFDPTRANNREHLAFSAGVHYCLGAGLARLEAAIALRELFARYPDLRQAGTVRRRRSRNIHGVLHLPVTGHPVRQLVR